MNYLEKKTIEDINVTDKKILLRCDFNVPIDKNGNISDTSRIDRAIETIKYLIEHKARVIICSHLGRPNGFDSQRPLGRGELRLDSSSTRVWEGRVGQISLV